MRRNIEFRPLGGISSSARCSLRVVVPAVDAEYVCTRAIPHTLRHVFASELLRAGANLRLIQELLGH